MASFRSFVVGSLFLLSVLALPLSAAAQQFLTAPVMPQATAPTTWPPVISTETD